MMWHGKVSENKAYELILFSSGWSCIIDAALSWTTKKSGQDHWGFAFCLVLFGIKIIEFNLYDVRHNEDDEEV